MNIHTKKFGTITSTRPRPSGNKNLDRRERQATPRDEFVFSGGGLSGKHRLQVATVGMAGALLGSFPGAGALTNATAATLNIKERDELGALIGFAGTVSNLAACFAVSKFDVSPLAFAVPGVLGAISWTGYALAKC